MVKYVSPKAVALMIVQWLSALSGWCSCPTSQVRVSKFYVGPLAAPFQVCAAPIRLTPKDPKPLRLPPLPARLGCDPASFLALWVFPGAAHPYTLSWRTIRVIHFLVKFCMLQLPTCLPVKPSQKKLLRNPFQMRFCCDFHEFCCGCGDVSSECMILASLRRDSQRKGSFFYSTWFFDFEPGCFCVCFCSLFLLCAFLLLRFSRSLLLHSSPSLLLHFSVSSFFPDFLISASLLPHVSLPHFVKPESNP